MTDTTNTEQSRVAAGGRLERLVMPDECTSLSGCQGGSHCMHCSHALYFGEVYARGRRWPFEFSPLFGVFFTRTSDGEPKALQPSPEHPVWDAWGEWHKSKFEA